MFGFKIDKFNDVPVALASTAEHIHMRIIPHVHITRLFLFISTIIRVLRDYCKGTNKRVCPTLVIDISEDEVDPKMCDAVCRRNKTFCATTGAQETDARRK